MDHATPLIDANSNRSLICLIVRRLDLPRLTGVDEVLDKVGPSVATLALWAVGFNGDERECLPIHKVD